jgi:hypothetical protein
MVIDCNEHEKELLWNDQSILTVKGEYEIQQVQGNQPITSLTFPNFKLTADQVLMDGR